MKKKNTIINFGQLSKRILSVALSVVMIGNMTDLSALAVGAETTQEELLGLIDSVQNSYLKKLLQMFFVEDGEFVKAFKQSSAAKTVHHGFVGGLLQHTLGVTRLCDYYCTQYPVLKRDLLLTAAICHDIGKTKELSLFPENDYTDDGQFLGHIVIGSEMVGEKIRQIPGFPKVLENELKHCILWCLMKF